MSAEFSLDSVVVASKGQVSSSLGDEAAILDSVRGVYYGLNPVGTRVWNLLQKPVKIAELRDSLVLEYEVEPARCEADLFELLSRLESAGLIEVRESPRG